MPEPAPQGPDNSTPRRSDAIVAMLGNPNVGKTTLFNTLTGQRHKAANFPGTTQTAEIGTHAHATLIDLPGTYTLTETDNNPEGALCNLVLKGDAHIEGNAVGACIVVASPTSLVRALLLMRQAADHKLPMVLALTMADEQPDTYDLNALQGQLGCPVIQLSGKTGKGCDQLADAIKNASRPTISNTMDFDASARWAEALAKSAHRAPNEAPSALTDRLDAVATHPVLGLLIFATVMTGLFYVIFKLAAVPMDMIDALFSAGGDHLGALLPEGLIKELLIGGVLAGVGSTVIFLPQICILFFLIALLEASGYLARAAFVIDRLMRPFGLSGQSFVPLLSGHACALPGIMSARGIRDPKERLATILALPFASCTARIPVYVLLTGILFRDSPAMQALAFTGCYVLGASAALLSAMLARRTFLRGTGGALAIELPNYRLPSLKSALATMTERGWVFLKKAGVFILGISIVLWWLGTFPHTQPPAESEAYASYAESIEAGTPAEPPTPEALGMTAEEAQDRADRIASAHAAPRTFLGRAGTAAAPLFAPLGADRQLTVGILASFAAREVFVSTMAVQTLGVEEEDDDETLLTGLATATRDDGSPIFDRKTSWAMLVFYVLAMQCLPTLVVTAREAGGWKWAGLQLGWMTLLAYLGAAIVYAVVPGAGG